MDWKEMINEVGGATKKNAPTILTAFGIVGFITTVSFAIKATPKAELLIDRAIQEKAIIADTPEEDVELTKMEMVKAVAVAYWPTAVMGLLSIAAIVSSDYISERRTTAVAAAYTLSEKALETFQQKTIEKIGQKTVDEIHSEIASDELKDNPHSTCQLLVTGKGKTICYDSLSGRYFMSDRSTIQSAVNKINEQLLEEMYVSLNEFYGEIGIPDISIGNTLGWDIQTDGQLKVKYLTKLTDDGEPCLVIKYDVGPYPYDKRFM